MARTVLLVLVALASVAALAAGCGDLGDELQSPAGGGLTATPASVTLPPGGSRDVTINGGNPPYTVDERPDTAVAGAALANNADRTGTLRITAPSTATVGGATSVTIKDTEITSGAGENEIRIPITIASPGTAILVGGGPR
jgi:hypothetical protein